MADQGLRFAALVEMAGVPLYVVDAHGHRGENKFKWLSKIKNGELAGKRILVLEDDVMSGRTLDLVIDKLRELSPSQVDLLLIAEKFYSNGSAQVLTRFDHLFFLEEISKKTPHKEAVKLIQMFMRRQIAYQKKRDDRQSLQEIVISLEERFKKLHSKAVKVMSRKVFKEKKDVS